MKLIPALFLLLTGCAVFSEPPGTQIGTSWIKTHEPLSRHIWMQVPDDELMARCSFRFLSGHAACAFRLQGGPDGAYCLIISSATEQDAKTQPVYGPTGSQRTLDGKPETLWLHELKHCAGYSHEVTE